MIFPKYSVVTRMFQNGGQRRKYYACAG